MAGPETPLATGQIDVQEAIDQGAAASGLVAPTPTVPAAADPINSGGSQGGPNLSFQAPEFYRGNIPDQRDFYPDPQVRQFGFDTGLVPVAHAGQVPLGILANQLAEKQRQKKELDAQLRGFDPYGGIGNAPDPYQQNFGRLARADMDKYIADVAHQYGGDQRMAVKAILSDPTLNRNFKNRAAQWNDTGTAAKHWFAQAQDYIDSVEQKGYQADPEAYQMAHNMRNAIGEFGGPNGGDVMELNKLGREFEKHMSRELYVKSYLTKALTDYAGKTPIEPKTTVQNGQRITTYGDRQVLQPFWEQQADAMASKQIGPGDNYQERFKNNLEYMRKMFPEDVDLKIHVTPPHYAKESGDGKGPEGKLAVSVGLTPNRTSDPQRAEAYKWGLGTGTDNVPTIGLSEDTGGKFKQLAPRTFSESRGTDTRQTTLNAPQLKFINGEWMIVGTDVNSNDVQELEKVTAEQGDDSADVQRLKQKISEGKMKFLPVKDNMPQLKSYLGNDFSTERLTQQQAAAKGIEWDQAKFDSYTKEQKQKIMTKLFE